MMKNPEILLRFSIKSAFFLVLALVSTTAAFAQSKGQASGTLTINDGSRSKTVELKYVYATQGDYGHDVHLTFTDKPLPDDPVKRWRQAQFAAAEGKLHALVVVITDKTVDYSVLFLDTRGTPAADRDCWMNFEDRKEQEDYYNDPKDEQIFEPKVRNEQTISGTLRSTLLQDADYHNKKVSYQYRLTFNAALSTDLPEADRLQSDSDAGKTYRRFSQALAAGDFETAKKFFVADKTKLFEGADGQKWLPRMKTITAPFQNVN
jgi:hypothetical protein